MKEIIQKAKEYAVEEIEKFGTPKMEHFELANKKGQELAEKLGANKDIVMLGTILMDLKLGECFNEGKIEEHVERSSTAAREFLDKFDLDEGTKNKIINCVEAHHAKKEFSCKEAEICANADCYRFLSPRGVLSALILFGNRNLSTDFCLDKVEAKVDEKYGILSLDFCKEELEESYQKIKKMLSGARKI